MIILASGSPRRRELLARLVPKFKTVPAAIDERALPVLAPAPYVEELAIAKSRAVAQEYPDATIIAADTMVAFGDKLLGKPKDRNAARKMITKLSGQTHHVHTGLVVRTPKGLERTTVVTTAVTFWDLTPDEIERYLDKDSYADKAGAYGIQDDGALLIKSISGDYYNVMGLPISTLARML